MATNFDIWTQSEEAMATFLKLLIDIVSKHPDKIGRDNLENNILRWLKEETDPHGGVSFLGKRIRSTNFEKITSSEEALAEFISDVIYDCADKVSNEDGRRCSDCNMLWCSKQDVFWWLKQESTE